jgi:hypothetical protein
VISLVWLWFWFWFGLVWEQDWATGYFCFFLLDETYRLDSASSRMQTRRESHCISFRNVKGKKEDKEKKKKKLKERK